MITRPSRIVPLMCGVAWMATTCAALAQNPPRTLPADLRESLVKRLKSLKEELEELRWETPRKPADLRIPSDRPVADAAIFAKGLEWALDYDQEFTPAEEKLLENAVDRCQQRIASLKVDETPWNERRGKIALGYVSSVDDSVQPYGVIVPKDYDPEKCARLDIVLHGSQRPVGMVELRFINRFDEGDHESSNPPDQPFIELHPLGRVENCYRWAGETDVFEAFMDIRRRYKIDHARIVLRGMSMGASGTWHLGLKHPGFFAALGPYCGYVDTHRFSETPLPNFVKVGKLPEYQELGLHMLDSVDYAANAGVVPTIAAMGEKDIFFDAHVIMGEAMKKEGLEMTNLISPGTGHVIDPKTHAEQMRRIGEHVNPGKNRSPASLRFVTWTLKYNQCLWLMVDSLKQHYRRAEFSAKVDGDRLLVAKPVNITRFSITLDKLPNPVTSIRIGACDLPIPEELRGHWVQFEQQSDGWSIKARAQDPTRFRKRLSVHGPIDDAFTRSFICVRGTGTPWNQAVHDCAEASLERFAREWRQYFRGELRIKNDVEVTENDLRFENVILFGDPGSNSWMAKVQADFPIEWTTESVKLGDQEYSAADHLPAFIMPNTLRGGGLNYIVINSGHTFRGEDLGKVNYLLFPRWGDWAVLKIDPNRKATEPVTEEVVKAGFFNEEWKLP